MILIGTKHYANSVLEIYADSTNIRFIELKEGNKSSKFEYDNKNIPHHIALIIASSLTSENISVNVTD